MEVRSGEQCNPVASIEAVEQRVEVARLTVLVTARPWARSAESLSLP